MPRVRPDAIQEVRQDCCNDDVYIEFGDFSIYRYPNGAAALRATVAALIHGYFFNKAHVRRIARRGEAYELVTEFPTGLTLLYRDDVYPQVRSQFPCSSFTPISFSSLSVLAQIFDSEGDASNTGTTGTNGTLHWDIVLTANDDESRARMTWDLLGFLDTCAGYITVAIDLCSVAGEPLLDGFLTIYVDDVQVLALDFPLDPAPPRTFDVPLHWTRGETHKLQVAVVVAVGLMPGFSQLGFRGSIGAFR